MPSLESAETPKAALSLTGANPSSAWTSAGPAYPSAAAPWPDADKVDPDADAAPDASPPKIVARLEPAPPPIDEAPRIASTPLPIPRPQPPTVAQTAATAAAPAANTNAEPATGRPQREAGACPGTAGLCGRSRRRGFGRSAAYAVECRPGKRAAAAARTCVRWRACGATTTAAGRTIRLLAGRSAAQRTPPSFVQPYSIAGAIANPTRFEGQRLR